MASVIQRITLILDVSDEFEGRRVITFDADMTPYFLAAVQAQWHDYSLRLIEEAKAEALAGHGFSGFLG